MADETFDQIAKPSLDAPGRRVVQFPAAHSPAGPERTRSAVYAFLLSTAVIFVAELGDKSQLMAMTFAARYRARDVLIGITAATAIVHLASPRSASATSSANTFADKQHWISIVAGVAFLGFAAWTLRGDQLTEDEADTPSSHRDQGTRWAPPEPVLIGRQTSPS